MNWTRIEEKWAAMAQRVRAAGPLGASGKPGEPLESPPDQDPPDQDPPFQIPPDQDPPDLNVPLQDPPERQPGDMVPPALPKLVLTASDKVNAD